MDCLDDVAKIQTESIFQNMAVLSQQDYKAILKKFGRQLRLAREESDFVTQAEVARLLNMGRDRVCQLENGKVEPRLSEIVLFAKTYKKPIEGFLFEPLF
ncbi:MAG TPA: helix-turn-helix transcriptional regulator [Cyanophyceae cyanobacterium]